MAIDWQNLDQQPRLLMEARLKPAQGTRFQPTGFPDLGTAAYQSPGEDGDAVEVVLVESAQSIANRLEAVCWDEARGAPIAALEGMPYVTVALWDSGSTTNSILEAHRLNSPYIMRDEEFADQLRADAGLPGGKEMAVGEFNRAALARAAFKYDPGSVLHGVFLEKLVGLARLQRCLSGFIEARNSSIAYSGGVKNDRIAPAPTALRRIGLDVSAQDGFGNVPFHRTEYTAERIMAYFSLDLAQIRAYGLGESAERFLITLALWKVRKFLDTGLRLRTACDLDMVSGLEVTRPGGFAVPGTCELEDDLPGLIKACARAGLFAMPPITELTFAGK